MGKTGKWIKNLLIGKKEKDRGGGGGGGSRGGKEIYSTPTTPIATSTPKERKRWSFRRSSKESNSMDYSTEADSAMLKQAMLDSENEQKKQALVMAAATAAAADAAVAAAQAAATVIHLTVAAENRRRSAVEEAAAIKIQSVFRSHLARKALRALKGLVKLQALVRGHLVRKQAATTIRCMQALLNVQARARAKRMLMAEETESLTQRLSNNSKSYRNSRFRQTYNMERGIEDDVKVVEMDIGQSRLSSKSRRRYSTGTHVERADQRFSPHYHSHSNQDYLYQMSPGASTLTDMTPRAYSFDATQTPLSAEYISQDCEIIPNYMTNTESFKAKARSQSAPKQRPELYERQSSRRKPSNVPRGIRMQRSSSQVGSTGSWYQFPWSIQLNRSIMSLQDSECGSTSTVITNTTNYCKSLVAYEVGNY